jgi:hypothetical protein
MKVVLTVLPGFIKLELWIKEIYTTFLTLPDTRQLAHMFIVLTCPLYSTFAF